MTLEGFYDVSVIVEGALDQSEVFPDTQRGRLAKGTFLGNLEREAKRESFRAEVFEVFHGHSIDVHDCSCVQYLTDNHPDYVFGPDGPEDSHDDEPEDRDTWGTYQDRIENDLS